VDGVPPRPARSGGARWHHHSLRTTAQARCWG
jgi:hypothetical protein